MAYIESEVQSWLKRLMEKMNKKKLFVPDKYADENKPITDDIGYEISFVKEEDRFLDPEKLNASLKERLPNPTGGDLLLFLSRKAKSDGGIFIPDKVREQEALATTVLCFKHWPRLL